MAKEKKKSKKQNKAEAKVVSAPTFTDAQMQHLIACAIVEADEIKEQEHRKQQEADLQEWRTAIGYKEFDDSNRVIRGIKSFFNQLWCILKICFVPSKAVKGDRASFALMKLFLCLFFGVAECILTLASLLLVIYGFALFFLPNAAPLLGLSNAALISIGISVFLISRLFRIAGIEVSKIEDRNYLFGLFASVTSIASIVIAIIAIVKGG